MHRHASHTPRAFSLFLAAVLTVVGLNAASTASADPVQRRLAKARGEQQTAQEEVRTTELRLAKVLHEYRQIQERLSRAAIDVVSSYQVQENLAGQLAAAQEELDRRATEAYEVGPAITLEMFLGSATPGDFAAAQEFAARAFVVDENTVTNVTRLRATLADLTVQREARQHALAASAEQLDDLATQATLELSAAKAKARKAGLTVRRLQREQRALREAQAAADSSLSRLVDPSRGKDQSELLALLGPSGGRTCDIPSGLKDTGRDLDGNSSWYGWDFAGQRTASGAIFDPRLFTLANKELPLGVFLRINYKGRCAIALVNDRGPYGVPGRIFDVSEAVAKYLGYKGGGVGYVTTDVLVAA